MRAFCGAIINGIVEAVSHISSNKPLFVVILLGSAWWMLYNGFARHPFDSPGSGYPLLILIYTIVFGLYEGAMKIVQAAQVRRDDHARAIQMQTLESIEVLATDIRAELDHARDRDVGAAQRDEVLIALCNRMLDYVAKKKEEAA